MKNLQRMSIQFLLLLAAGCSSGQSSSSTSATNSNTNSPNSPPATDPAPPATDPAPPASDPAPPATDPAPPETDPAPPATDPTPPETDPAPPATDPPPPADPTALQLLCGDWETAQAGSYKVQNNVWGKGNLTGYSQCVGIGEGENKTAVARWTWNWLEADTKVKAYPEIIFGRKPGHASTTTALPCRIKEINAATVSFNYSSTHSGRGNCAFDLWLSRGPEIVSDANKIEVMIWLDWYGGIHPAGLPVRSASIAGRDYDIFAGADSGRPYIAYLMRSPLIGAGKLDMRSFLEDLKNSGLLTDDDYLQSIEFGNETSTGTGDTILYSYSVEITRTEPEANP